MKSLLVLLMLTFTILVGQAQVFNIDLKIGAKVSISDNERNGLPNVYIYNEAYKISGKYRFEPIGGGLSSKSNLLGKVFTIEEIIPCKFDYKRIIILSDDNNKLLYDYTIGSISQLVEVTSLSKEALNEQKQKDIVDKPNVIRIVDLEKFRPNYPDGVYLSKESFMLKTPKESHIIPVFRKGRRVTKVDTIPQVCDFIYTSSEDIVKNCFAVSYKGYLYFRSGAMVKYKSKNDRAETVRAPNTFSRVLMGGKRFFYTEYEFVNQWAAGFAANGGAVGGTMYNSLFDQKGVVWDFQKQEFDIFKSCKNYNLFLEELKSESKMDCKGGNRPKLVDVRAFIKKVM